ncbi:hypothetical protein [Kutzneria sp. 744]|uniref:hypothetical protein n=1 Tax=Kutzneria sp. (strain 744) TaxID=345341 RepID=UPI0004BA20E3|nr:hypothetical protein [Kutzneria sp. 744]
MTWQTCRIRPLARHDPLRLSGTPSAQELDLQPAEGGFAELTLTQPGTYTITTHRLADAERGAMGSLIADP